MGFSEDLQKNVYSEDTAIQTKDKELEDLKGLEIGSCLHEDWRETRKREDGTYEPRWKKVKDSSFVYVESDTCRKNEEGAVEIDIANRSFAELSADWQHENLEAGKVVARVVGEKTELTPEEVEEMSSVIHDEWLKRNDWVFDPKYGKPALAVPYDQLSEEEKQKDRKQLKFGLSLNQRILSGEVKKQDLKQKFKANEAQVVE